MTDGAWSGSGLLETALLEDGIKLSGKGGSEKMIRCWNATNHKSNDDNPSMSVNVVKGVYNCFSCGITGNTYNYLVEFRKLTAKQTSVWLTEHGVNEESRGEIEKRSKQNKQSKRKNIVVFKSIPSTANGMPRVALYEYHSLDGKLVAVVVRYSKIVKGDAAKTLRHFTPKTGGGWYASGAANELLPDDVRIKLMPLYGAIELQKKLHNTPDRQVWLVEGEKCADAVSSIKIAGDPGFVSPPVSSFGNQKTDWKLLANKKILIISDGDEVGRRSAIKTGDILSSEYGCICRYAMVSGDDGYDIADKLAEVGYSNKKVRDWLLIVGIKKQEELENEKAKIDNLGMFAPIPPPPKDSESVFSKNRHYNLIGIAPNSRFDTGSVLIHKKHNWRVVSVNFTSLSRIEFLMTFAPLEFWVALNGDKQVSKESCVKFANEIIKESEKIGLVSVTDGFIGRGATIHQGRYYFNLGNAILHQDQTSPLRMSLTPKAMDSVPDVLFRAGIKIPINKQTEKMGAKLCSELIEALRMFPWADDGSLVIYAGWVVTSLIGGALPFRPMAWIVAPHDSGKTFLSSTVLELIFGNLLLKSSDSTEAGAASSIMDDSLPMSVDELEPDRRDETKQRDILALMRQATAGNNFRRRGTASGGSMGWRIRFSIMAASILLADMDEATKSRTFVSRLVKDKTVNWPAVQDAISKATETAKVKCIISHIIVNMPAIVQKADMCRMALLEKKYDSRRALGAGALQAGYSFLSGKDAADIMFDDDEDVTHDIIWAILDMKIKHNHVDISIAELVSSLDDSANLSAERYGIKRAYKCRRDDDDGIYICPSLLREIFQRTYRKYANTSVANLIKTIPGVYTKRFYIRFAGMRKNSLLIPMKILKSAGFDDAIKQQNDENEYLI